MLLFSVLLIYKKKVIKKCIDISEESCVGEEERKQLQHTFELLFTKGFCCYTRV